MTFIELVRQRLQKHLKSFKKLNKLNQREMAAHIGVGYRSYQDIEGSGDAVKADNLILIIEKTGFNITQEVAQPELTAIKAAIKFLVDQEVQKEVKATSRPEEEIREQFRKTMKATYGLSLEEI